MAKALEALNYLYDTLRLTQYLGVVESAKIKSAYEYIKQRLVAIDNANPSEALKDLAFIKEKFAYLEYNSENYNVPKKELFNIEQALINAEKEHKALEIIKRKNVDVFRFKKLDFNTFNQLQRSCKLPELTKEEFNLLKEVLDNGKRMG